LILQYCINHYWTNNKKKHFSIT